MNKMIQRMLISAAALVTVATVARGQQRASDEEKLRKIAEQEQALSGPVAEHKLLSRMVGKWDKEVKLWPGPAATPIITKGACENKMILGGRFLKSESAGTGSPIETLQIMGFDRRFGKYTYVGYDNYGTYYVTAEGAFEAGTKTFTLHGEEAGSQPGQSQKYDIVVRFISPTKYVTEVIFKKETPPGGHTEFKVAEITFTQSK
jgi:hypothetical protein